MSDPTTDGRAYARATSRGYSMEAIVALRQEAELNAARYREGTERNRYWRGVIIECFRMERHKRKGLL